MGDFKAFRDLFYIPVRPVNDINNPNELGLGEAGFSFESREWVLKHPITGEIVRPNKNDAAISIILDNVIDGKYYADGVGNTLHYKSINNISTTEINKYSEDLYSKLIEKMKPNSVVMEKISVYDYFKMDLKSFFPRQMIMITPENVVFNNIFKPIVAPSVLKELSPEYMDSAMRTVFTAIEQTSTGNPIETFNNFIEVNKVELNKLLCGYLLINKNEDGYIKGEFINSDNDIFVLNNAKGSVFDEWVPITNFKRRRYSLNDTNRGSGTWNRIVGSINQKSYGSKIDKTFVTKIIGNKNYIRKMNVTHLTDKEKIDIDFYDADTNNLDNLKQFFNSIYVKAFSDTIFEDYPEFHRIYEFNKNDIKILNNLRASIKSALSGEYGFYKRISTDPLNQSAKIKLTISPENNLKFISGEFGVFTDSDDLDINGEFYENETAQRKIEIGQEYEYSPVQLILKLKNKNRKYIKLSHDLGNMCICNIGGEDKLFNYYRSSEVLDTLVDGIDGADIEEAIIQIHFKNNSIGMYCIPEYINYYSSTYEPRFGKIYNMILDSIFYNNKINDFFRRPSFSYKISRNKYDIDYKENILIPKFFTKILEDVSIVGDLYKKLPTGSSKYLISVNDENSIITNNEVEFLKFNISDSNIKKAVYNDKYCIYNTTGNISGLIVASTKDIEISSTIIDKERIHKKIMINDEWGHYDSVEEIKGTSTLFSKTGYFNIKNNKDLISDIINDTNSSKLTVIINNDNFPEIDIAGKKIDLYEYDKSILKSAKIINDKFVFEFKKNAFSNKDEYIDYLDKNITYLIYRKSGSKKELVDYYIKEDCNLSYDFGFFTWYKSIPVGVFPELTDLEVEQYNLISSGNITAKNGGGGGGSLKEITRTVDITVETDKIPVPKELTYVKGVGTLKLNENGYDLIEDINYEVKSGSIAFQGESHTGYYIQLKDYNARVGFKYLFIYYADLKSLTISNLNEVIESGGLSGFAVEVDNKLNQIIIVNETLKNTVNDVKNEVNTKLTAIEANNTSITNKITVIENNYTTINNDITAIKSAIDLLKSKVPVAKNITVPTTGWVDHNEPGVQYKKKITVSVAGIKATEVPQINFDKSCLEAIGEAGLSYVESVDDAIILYAKTVPTKQLTGLLIIHKFNI